VHVVIVTQISFVIAVLFHWHEDNSSQNIFT